MPLSVEELLKPRYKVKVKFPRSIIPVGSTFWIDNESVVYITSKGQKKITSSYYYSEPEEYPDVFELLPWWMDRKKEDLPEYIKFINNAGTRWEIMVYLKVDEWIMDEEYARPDYFGSLAFGRVKSFPITREDYDLYQSTVK